MMIPMAESVPMLGLGQRGLDAEASITTLNRGPGAGRLARIGWIREGRRPEMGRKARPPLGPAVRRRGAAGRPLAVVDDRFTAGPLMLDRIARRSAPTLVAVPNQRICLGEWLVRHPCAFAADPESHGAEHRSRLPGRAELQLSPVGRMRRGDKVFGRQARAGAIVKA